jgi:hypothetical protein
MGLVGTLPLADAAGNAFIVVAFYQELGKGIIGCFIEQWPYLKVLHTITKTFFESVFYSIRECKKELENLDQV